MPIYPPNYEAAQIYGRKNQGGSRKYLTLLADIKERWHIDDRLCVRQSRFASCMGKGCEAGIGATVQPVSHWRGRPMSESECSECETLFDTSSALTGSDGGIASMRNRAD